MWLNERRRGPGGALPPCRQPARFLFVLVPPRLRPRRPPRRARPPVKVSLVRGWPPQGPGPRRPAARGLRGSQAPAPQPAGRASAAAGAAPQEPPPRTVLLARAGGGGGGGAGPLKSAARRPDPPRRGAALVAPRLRAGGFPAGACGRRADDPGAPRAARAWSGTTWRSLFRVRERCALPPSLFMFLGGYWDLMAIWYRTEVRPLLKKNKK